MSSVHRDRGFSLIELMIVVSIIGILGVIAVSTLGDSEVEAMEKQVVSNMRAISAAQLVYRSGHGGYAVAGTSTNKDSLIGAGLIDSAWNQAADKNLDAATGVKRGSFQYFMKVAGAAYAVFAEPTEGSPHSYGMTKDGVIYMQENIKVVAAKDSAFSGTGFKILE